MTAETGPVSKAIRAASKGGFSHAILYVGDGSYIHSDSDGVHSGNIQRLLFDKQKHCAVLRPKPGANQPDVQAAINFARNEVGKQYSVRAAIRTKTAGAGRTDESDNRQFCSRLVAQAYAFAGLPLVKNSHYCSPAEIAQSDVLLVVSGCVRRAMREELKMAHSPNPLELQTKITNKVHKKTDFYLIRS